ncbi:MAG: diguanylate cyclase [Chloroflexi bacterium]|nr:diguanylate cyclase [Chloroflexota bacterium]
MHRQSEKLDDFSPDDAQKMLHELQVHQIELEMQNDELRRTQLELEASRDQYADLYDFAPIGYLTNSEQGVILNANLTAASLLSTPKGSLIGKPFTRFIIKEDQDIYYLKCKRLFETGEEQTCELRIKGKDGVSFWVQINSLMTQDSEGQLLCRVTLSDITERVQAEISVKQQARKLARSNAFTTMLSEVSLHVGTSLNSRKIMEILGVELKKLGLDCVIATQDSDMQAMFIRYDSLDSKALTLSEKLLGLNLRDFPVPRAIWEPLAPGIFEREQPLFVSRLVESTAVMMPHIPLPLLERSLRLAGVSVEDSVAYLPLMARRQPIGILAVWGPSLVEKDIPILSVFARQIAITLENARLYNTERAKTYDLDGRVKELNCLYGISHLFETPDISLERILQGTVELLPPAWHYPQITCARIIYGKQEFRTTGFEETIWKQAAMINVSGEQVGAVEVYYREENSESDAGVFLKEKRSLIDEVTERLGDIIERMEMEGKLRQQARNDPLTGILNRRYFFELAEKELERAHRYEHPLSVIMFDIDHFKRVNDSYGHSVGDQALCMLTAECQTGLRENDLFARYGGEEFIILLPEADQKQADQMAERIRKRLSGTKSLKSGAKTIFLTASFGVASLNGKKLSLDNLIIRSDGALYAAKKAGRNRVVVWNPEI